jgi:MoaA/NifB/PqqE/SkfB family radical SAM enzyme
LRVIDYLRKLMHRDISRCCSLPAREANLLLYRSSRKVNSQVCPNLPLILLVESTSKCNLSCKMCNIHFQTKSGIVINNALLEATFELAKTANTVYPFGLGEPLLYPEITRIVGRYKSIGGSVALVTNGMLLSEKIARELIMEGLDQLSLSVDAADPSLLASIRRGADLNRIAENVATLNRLKRSLQHQNPFLVLNVVVQKSNFYHLHELIRLAQEWDISLIVLHPITVHKHIPEIQREALNGNISHWRKTLDMCWKEAELRGIKLDAQRLLYILNEDSPEEVYREIIPCPEPFRFMGIRANGDIFPCCNWDFNNPITKVPGTSDISYLDFEKAWQSPSWQVLREKIVSGEYPEQCMNCISIFARPLHDEHLGGE